MNEEQTARLNEVLKKVKATQASNEADSEIQEFENFKLVDCFNALIVGASAKLDVIQELLMTAGNLPDDTPSDFIKYEAAKIEAIMRPQLNGLCDCLLAVVACEENEMKEAC